jgi:hypothetical protein
MSKLKAIWPQGKAFGRCRGHCNKIYRETVGGRNIASVTITAAEPVKG